MKDWMTNYEKSKRNLKEKIQKTNKNHSFSILMKFPSGIIENLKVHMILKRLVEYQLQILEEVKMKKQDGH